MKKILFAATGGTIACAKTESGLSPQLTSEQLLEYLPEIGGMCRVEAVQPFCLDSTNMSPREWCALARLIRERYAEFDGFVIAHGTDTLGYGAAALSCLVQNSAKPVVMTGSQKPMSEKGTDALRNLRDAFAYACADGAWGVRVVFCGRVIDGRSAVKCSTHDFDAFRSINRADVGAVSEHSVDILHGPHSGETRFFGELDARAAVVKLTPMMPPEMLRTQTARALIIEGFGAGGLPDYGNGGYEREVAALVRRGVYVIMSTQVVSGGSNLSLYRVGNEISQRFSLPETGQMTTEFALMKTMWALAQADNREDFPRLFSAEI